MMTGVVIFTFVFARLAIDRHRTFGTWAFDLGIYDQGFWLVSRVEVVHHGSRASTSGVTT